MTETFEVLKRREKNPLKRAQRLKKLELSTLGLNKENSGGYRGSRTIFLGVRN